MAAMAQDLNDAQAIARRARVRRQLVLIALIAEMPAICAHSSGRLVVLPTRSHDSWK